MNIFAKKPDLNETLFNLRFTAKQLEKLSAKAEKQHVAEQAKVKRAIQQRNIEGARIYAENAIRKKNESLNYLRLAGRIDGVQSRVQTAISMQTVTKNMASVTKDLERAMSSMNLEQVEAVMSKFEKQFENLDVHTSTVENAMNSAMTLNTPEGQVNALIQQVADENGLEISDQLNELTPASSVPATASTTGRQMDQEDDLSRRLQQLRG